MSGLRKNKGNVIPEGQLEMVVFKGKAVRRVVHKDEWYFSIVDAVEVLAGSSNPHQDWIDLQSKLRNEEGYDELDNLIVQLPIASDDGTERQTDMANVETLFRIVQSIPSKKADRFKRWLAKTGYDRILEYQNPDIAIKRAILDYKEQGRSDEWIEFRVSGMLVREELTGEWSRRGVADKEYGVLTNLIHEKTFDVSVKRHKTIKGLKKQNLRDHMTSNELLFTRLGEASTKDIAVASDARGFQANRDAAEKGGQIAGDARKALEEQTGISVVSSSNYLGGKSAKKELPGN